ncbi:hypothetical protein GCM10022629_83710 [Amorphoplanes auranticolor]
MIGDDTIQRGGHHWAPLGRRQRGFIRWITTVTSPRSADQDGPPYLVKANLTTPAKPPHTRPRTGVLRVNTPSKGDLTERCAVAGFVKVSVGNALLAPCGHRKTWTLKFLSQRGHP